MQDYKIIGSAALILGAAIVCGGLICNPLHARASTSPAPAKISGFGGDFGCGPHLLAGLPEGPREPSDSDSSKRRDDAFQRVNNFSDLKQDEWRKVIGGAVFVAGLSFLAYLARRA